MRLRREIKVSESRVADFLPSDSPTIRYEPVISPPIKQLLPQLHKHQEYAMHHLIRILARRSGRYVFILERVFSEFSYATVIAAMANLDNKVRLQQI